MPDKSNNTARAEARREGTSAASAALKRAGVENNGSPDVLTSVPYTEKEENTPVQQAEAQTSTPTTGQTDLTGGQTVDVDKAMKEGEFLTPQQTNSGSTLNYDAMLQMINADAPETEAERRRRERKEKRAKLFAAIGDGIGALSNLYFATQGAPSTEAGKNTMSGKLQERLDRLQRERDARKQSYLMNYLRLQQMKRADENDELTRSYQQQALEHRRNELEERRQRRHLDEWKADIYEKKVDGTFDIQKEKNAIQRDLAAGRINKMEADARSNWLRAQAAMKKAENGNSGVGGYTTTTEIERDRKGKETRRTTTRTPAGKDKNDNNESYSNTKRLGY